MKYRITLDAITTRTFWFEVEAESEEQAEELALEKDLSELDVENGDSHTDWDVVDAEEIV